jgi:putative component of membrane protein insertase Oxa1/YidC/SpoIIIJ protein YidD
MSMRFVGIVAAVWIGAGCASPEGSPRYTRITVVRPAPSPFAPFDSSFDERLDHRTHGRKPARRSSLVDVSEILWRDVISHADGPRCSHYPTCSQFAAQAVRRYGVSGLYYTTSRLFSEYGDIHAHGFYELQIRGGRGRIHDPVDSYRSLETERTRQVLD